MFGSIQVFIYIAPNLLVMLSQKEFDELYDLKKLIVESPGTPQINGYIYGSQTSSYPDHWVCGVDRCKFCKKGDAHICRSCKCPANHKTSECPINNKGKFGYGGYIIVNGYQLWYCGDSECEDRSVHYHQCTCCCKTFVKTRNTLCNTCKEIKVVPQNSNICAHESVYY